MMAIKSNIIIGRVWPKTLIYLMVLVNDIQDILIGFITWLPFIHNDRTRGQSWLGMLLVIFYSQAIFV